MDAFAGQALAKFVACDVGFFGDGGHAEIPMRLDPPRALIATLTRAGALKAARARSGGLILGECLAYIRFSDITRAIKPDFAVK